MNQTDYETDVVIDESALDVEWLEQPRLMMKYARKAAEARRKMDEAKENVEYIRAELDKEIRQDPDKFGIAKISETAIQNTILMEDSYRKASAEFAKHRFEADISRGAVSAFEHRRDALENLVRLHGQQYFAGPRVPRNLTEEREAKQADTNQRIGAAMQRRRASSE